MFHRGTRVAHSYENHQAQRAAFCLRCNQLAESRTVGDRGLLLAWERLERDGLADCTNLGRGHSEEQRALSWRTCVQEEVNPDIITLNDMALFKYQLGECGAKRPFLMNSRSGAACPETTFPIRPISRINSRTERLSVACM